MTTVVLRNVRLVPVGGLSSTYGDQPVDVRIADGFVAEVAPTLSAHDVEEVYDGGGRWAMPGLWDHHVHMGQWSLNRARLDLSDAHDVADALDRVGRHLATQQTADLVTAFGHRSAGWADQPTVAALDRVTGSVPTVLVSGDVHHGWLNTAALDLFGLPRREGVVRELEWFQAQTRIAATPAISTLAEAHYPQAAAEAAGRGVVGITDMEFEYVDRWPERVRRGVDHLRVRKSVYPGDLERAIHDGLRTGASLTDELVRMGPLKVISDGSLNTRTAHCRHPYAEADTLPTPCGAQNVSAAELTNLLRRASGAGLSAAVHAIGDAALGLALDAFEAAGARGSVEHVQLAAADDIARMRGLAVTASVQPAHLLDDRDLTEQYWPDRAGRSFAFRSLLDAGVEVVFGSDAPVAPLDPWLAMAAAVHRAPSGTSAWHPEQHLTAAEALAASTDGQPTIGPGSRGDIAVLDGNPLVRRPTSNDAAAALRGMRVAATFVGGRVTHLAL